MAGEIGVELMKAPRASIAHDKRFAFFDSQNRNEEQAEVMVNAPVTGLIQPANRAPAGSLIQNLYFRCDTGDEDHVSKFVYI
jgi:hypothetical protein